jgi:hypothetical protein
MPLYNHLLLPSLESRIIGYSSKPYAAHAQLQSIGVLQMRNTNTLNKDRYIDGVYCWCVDIYCGYDDSPGVKIERGTIPA